MGIYWIFSTKISCAGLNMKKINFNPFMANGLSHCYELDESISNFRDIGWYFLIFI